MKPRLITIISVTIFRLNPMTTLRLIMTIHTMHATKTVIAIVTAATLKRSNSSSVAGYFTGVQFASYLIVEFNII